MIIEKFIELLGVFEADGSCDLIQGHAGRNKQVLGGTEFLLVDVFLDADTVVA